MGHGGPALGSRGAVPRGLSPQSRLQGLGAVDRLSSQAVCWRGEGSGGGSGGTGICALQKAVVDVFSSFDDNGENRAAGAASGKCVPEE